MQLPHTSRHSRRPGDLVAQPLALGLALLALGLLVLSGCAANASGDPLVAARVNGRSVPLGLYQSILRFNRANAGLGGAAPDWQSPAGRAQLGPMQQDGLEFLLAVELQKQQLAAQHVTITAAQRKDTNDSLQSQLEPYRQEVKAQPGDTATRALLDAITPDVLQAIGDRISGRAALADQGTFPYVHVRAIAVNSQADAEQLRDQAQKGADFGKLAHDHSLDQESAQKNGDLGLDRVFPGGSLARVFPTFDASVFGPKAHLATSGATYIVLPSSQSSYALFEVTQPGTATLQSISDPQQRLQTVDAWLTTVVRPAAHVEQFVTTQ